LHSGADERWKKRLVVEFEEVDAGY
jgi:hypothetical protein